VISLVDRGGHVHGLGELEAAVMDVLWRLPGPHRVRDVRDQLAPQRTLAHTTVMTESPGAWEADR